MTKRRFFDNTILSSYKGCPRYYFLRHIKYWRPSGTSAALSFGLSWHGAQDVLWKFYKKVPLKELLDMAAAQFDQIWEEQGMPLEMGVEDIDRYAPRTPSVAREMLRNYARDRQHPLENSELVAVEQPFAVPVPGVLGEETSVWYTGRLDKVIKYNGQIIPLEHKTTTEYAKASGFRTSYIESWYLDSQVMGYLYGGSLFFEGVEQVWVDAALVHKQVHDKFRFIPVGHQWGMLEAWLADTKEWIARLLRDELLYQAKGGLVDGVFPKQQGNCMGKYGPCPMLDICRTQPAPDKLEEPPAGYVVEKWEPFNILHLDKIFKDEKE